MKSMWPPGGILVMLILLNVGCFHGPANQSKSLLDMSSVSLLTKSAVFVWKSSAALFTVLGFLILQVGFSILLAVMTAEALFGDRIQESDDNFDRASAVQVGSSACQTQIAYSRERGHSTARSFVPEGSERPFLRALT